MSQQEVKTFKLYDKAVVIPIDEYIGINDYKFKVISGSRLLITMYVKSIDLGATASIKVLNAFSDDNNINQWDDILNFSSSDIGYKKQVLTDFNQFFNLRLEITGGIVELAVAVSVFDNAMTTQIENAQIDVQLSSKDSGSSEHDSIRIGDQNNEVEVTSEKELKVFDEKVSIKLEQQTASLNLLQDNLRQRILKAVDRVSQETVLDFGTKNERIVQIDYTAESVGTGTGFVARKSINYVLDGNGYRRTTTIWSIV
jgi:hypothetical protein